MPTPEDLPQVLSAVRLGWYVVEVRGRNRPGGLRSAAGPLPNLLGHVLPIRIERTGPELRIEAQAILCWLVISACTRSPSMASRRAGRPSWTSSSACWRRSLLMTRGPRPRCGTPWRQPLRSRCPYAGHPGRRVRQAVRGLPARPRAARSVLGAGSRRGVQTADAGMLGVPARRAPLRRADAGRSAERPF